MKYKLKCLQGSELKEDYIFNSKEEVLQNLADFHDMDYSGEKFEGVPYKDIYEFLTENMGNDTDKKLNWILDYGSWELIELK
jgi:hypothetical protein